MVQAGLDLCCHLVVKVINIKDVEVKVINIKDAEVININDAP